MDSGIAVVTIRVVGHKSGRLNNGLGGNTVITETVAVTVLIPGQAAFVRTAGAVIVFAVTDFLGPGMNTGIPVITVGVVGHKPGRRKLGHGGNTGITEIIAVTVLIPGQAGLVGQSVTVIVDAVTADFGHARIDAGITVVAVTGPGHGNTRPATRTGRMNRRIAVAVAVQILVTVLAGFIQAAGTVVVDSVAHFHGRGINCRIGVVAVGVVGYIARGLEGCLHKSKRVTEVVTVGVLIPCSATIVGQTAAVVVQAVAADLRLAGINSGITVITVAGPAHVSRWRNGIHNGHRGIPEIVTIGILVPGQAALVHAAGTVIVQAVAHFRCAGMHGRFGIIAVRAVQDIPGRLYHGYGRYGTVAVTVTVTVLIKGQAALVHSTVAVFIIQSVADFHRAGIDKRITVITIRIFEHITGRLGLGYGGISGIAVTVTVTVTIPGQAPLIDHPVAVVVDSVADFRCTGMNSRVTVITVIPVQHKSGRLGLGLNPDRAVAVAVAVIVPVPVQATLIPVAVAVLIGHPVITDFDRTGIDGGIGIVTIGTVQNVSRRLGL